MARAIVASLFEALERRRMLSTSTAGAIDPSFGQHGVGSISVDGTSFTNALDVAVQSDGKTIIVGSAGTDSGLQDVAVARLNADGTPDNSFGTNGLVLTDFSASDAEATRVVLDGNKILIAGDANGNFALARYSADGSLDKSFGGSGKVSLDLGNSDDKAWGLALQDDGKIVADGQSGGEVALVRFNSDGSLDTTFGSGGKTLTAAPGATAASAADGSGPTLDGSGGVQILHGGKILVVSNESEADGSGRVDFLYYNADGSLHTLDQGAVADSAPNVVDFSALHSGRVVTFGSDGTDTVQRYNADASLDSTFGQGGTAPATLDWGGYGAVQSDGKILVSGAGSVGFNEGMAVARYNADGSVDTSFGANGMVVSVSGGYSAAAVAVDGSGNMVAVGSSYGASNQTLTAVRFQPDIGVVAPTVSLNSAPPLTHSGNNQVIVTVTYKSADGIDPNSIDDGDLTVTRNGTDNDPNGPTTLPAYFLDMTNNADGSVTVRYQVQKDYSSHNFDANDNGTYTVALSDGAVYDFNGAAVASGNLGTFGINIAAPAGGLALPSAALGASGITAVNVTDATLSVTFTSPIGVDSNSLGGGLTVTGPNGFDQYAYFQDSKVNADGSVTATYNLQHDNQHQAFTSSDNGTYSVAIDQGAVTDIDGNPLTGGSLGKFRVDVPVAPSGPVPNTAVLQASDLNDPNATSELLKVTYRGSAGIAANTLDDFDIAVDGPNNYHQTATFDSSTVNSDGSVTATYSLTVGFRYGGPILLAGTTAGNGAGASSTPSPGTSVSRASSPSKVSLEPIWWGGVLANGTYTVSIAANQVNDTRGVSIAAARLGTFNVNLPPGTVPIGPIPLLYNTGTTTAQKTVSDPHHVNEVNAFGTTSAGTSTSTRGPVRAHALKHKKKHKHKHKKATTTSAVATLVAKIRASLTKR